MKTKSLNLPNSIAYQPSESGLSLYAALSSAGIPCHNHESDLYFPITAESTAILAKYPTQKSTATTFINQVEGGRWYDVPFSFVPWWEARQTRQEGK